MIRTIFLIGFCICSVASHATMQNDSIKRTKNYRYVGTQMNLLLQQFISFNSVAGLNTNPYIFIYAVNGPVSGKGTSLGLALSVTETGSNDGVSSITINNSSAAIRVGFDRKFFQHQKLIPSWGIDLAAGVSNNSVESRISQAFNSSRIHQETQRTFFGPSIRGGLLYAFTEHVLVGTEFFFNTQFATVVTRTQVNGVFTERGSRFSPLNVGFQTPTALFLIYRY